MSVQTTSGVPISSELMSNYLSSLVNRLFKILPIREQGDDSLTIYISSLQMELLGSKELIKAFQNDAIFLTLLSILQYLIDNPDCSVKTVRREVFHSISLCNKLKATYLTEV